MRQAKEWLHTFFILKLKPSMKKLFLSTMLAISATCANAYDFEANGMYFNIVSLTDLTVGVTCSDTYTNEFGYEVPIKPYSGDIVIPQTVEYLGKTFSVLGINLGAFDNSTLESLTIPENIIVASLNGNITKFHYHTSLINFGFSGAYMKNLSRSMFENFRHASKLADYTTTYFITFRRECVKKIVVTVQGPPKDFFLRLLLRKRFLLSACSIISSRRFSGSVSVSSFFWISPFRNSARSSPTLL